METLPGPGKKGPGIAETHGASRRKAVNVLQGHDTAHTMVALMKVYQEEDEAYQELVMAATTFFQYLLQPFRDMREVATLCKLDILKSLDEDDLGPKRIVALQKEAKEWSRRAEEAIVSIQDITVNYFKETVKALAGMQKQMQQDGKRFGQAAWAAATPRLEKLKLMLAQETLQLMRAKELCLNHKRAEIQGKMEDLPEQEKNIDVVDELEIQYYEVQLELYEVKFEILKYEEILLLTQLDSIKRLIRDKEGEVVYYDPCESPEELEAVGLRGDEALEMEELSRQCRRLESKRGRICVRRACLRNRQDQCRENHRLRLQLAAESMKRFHQHHSIQMRRDKIKEEERKRKEWINQERKKTLQRLRAFKERRPGGSAVKSPGSGAVAPHLPSRLTPWMAASSGETPEGSEAKTGEDQDCSGNTDPSSVPAGDQTHPEPSEELSPILLEDGLSVLNRKRLPVLKPHQDTSTLATTAMPPSPGGQVQRLASWGERVWFLDRTCSVGSISGSMDEVLASLRSSRSPLQRAEVTASPPPRASFSEQLLAAIRQGVKLRKVHAGLDLSPSSKPPSDLERSIKAALQRIKRVSAASEEDEEDGDELSPGSEWDG
ncbi:WASP homolog-associated protein with actin, membranes and microtubules [Crocuta crocuta]